MLTEISRGVHVYCVHTTSMSAAIIPIHLEDGTYLQLTFLKYDQYCKQILRVGVQNTLFTPRAGFLTSCLSVCVCVCVSVTKISKKILTRLTSFLVEAFPLTQGGNRSILKKIAPG